LGRRRRRAKLALRTQQVMAHETATPTPSIPLPELIFIESLTDQSEAEACATFEKIRRIGGAAVAAIEGRLNEDEIEGRGRLRWEKAVTTARRS